MDMLAYAWFIVVLALPYLVIAAIAAALIAGAAGIIARIGGRVSGALLGVMLISGSGTTATMLTQWPVRRRLMQHQARTALFTRHIRKYVRSSWQGKGCMLARSTGLRRSSSGSAMPCRAFMPPTTVRSSRGRSYRDEESRREIFRCRLQPNTCYRSTSRYRGIWLDVLTPSDSNPLRQAAALVLR